METLLEQQRRYHEERERLLDALVQVQHSTVQHSIVHNTPRAGETRREEDQQGRHQQRAQAEGHARQVRLSDLSFT